jgi:hypothetical protein
MRQHAAGLTVIRLALPAVALAEYEPARSVRTFATALAGAKGTVCDLADALRPSSAGIGISLGWCFPEIDDGFHDDRRGKRRMRMRGGGGWPIEKDAPQRSQEHRRITVSSCVMYRSEAVNVLLDELRDRAA